MSDPELKPTSTSFVLPQLAVGVSVLNVIELLASATAGTGDGVGVGVTLAVGIGVAVDVAAIVGVGVTSPEGVGVAAIVGVGVTSAEGVGVTSVDGVAVTDGVDVASAVGVTVATTETPIGFARTAGTFAGVVDGALKFVLTLHTGEAGSFCATMSCGEVVAGGVVVADAAFNAVRARAEGCQIASIF